VLCTSREREVREVDVIKQLDAGVSTFDLYGWK
jgi:hypothetical protein